MGSISKQICLCFCWNYVDFKIKCIIQINIFIATILHTEQLFECLSEISPVTATYFTLFLCTHFCGDWTTYHLLTCLRMIEPYRLNWPEVWDEAVLVLPADLHTTWFPTDALHTVDTGPASHTESRHHTNLTSNTAC